MKLYMTIDSLVDQITSFSIACFVVHRISGCHQREFSSNRPKTKDNQIISTADLLLNWLRTYKYGRLVERGGENRLMRSMLIRVVSAFAALSCITFGAPVAVLLTPIFTATSSRAEPWAVI